MRKWTTRMRWRNIRLPIKLVLVFMPLIILPALSGMLLVTQSYTSSSKEMTTKYATDMLNLVSQKIDDQLYNFEQLSKQIIIDQDLQQMISKKADSTFEKLQIESDINSKLNLFWLGDNQNEYIRSIIIDTPNGIYTYGQDDQGEYDINQIDYRKRILNLKGGTVWFEPKSFTNGSNEFTAFRLARSIQDKTLRNIGILTIVIDTQAITSIFENTLFQDNASLRLLSEEDKTILQNKYFLNSNDQILSFSQKDIHNGWHLSAQFSLNQLYLPIHKTIRLSLIIVFLCILFGLIVTHFIAIDLVFPIRKLMVNMKKGIKGVRPRELTHFKGAIEIVEMNNTFISVMYELEQLIIEAVKQEKEKKNAEIRMLQNQLSPHFLYNTLNAVRWMAIIQKQDNIKEIVDSLNQLLTYYVRDPGKKVPLKLEITMLENYVNIQKVRFQHFTFISDIEPELMQALVLKFLLQPIIENALIHGLTNTDHIGEVRVVGRLVGETVEITVSDNGIGMTMDQLSGLKKNLNEKGTYGNHFGLISIQERIQLHYGGNYGMMITSEVNAGVKVTLRFPYHSILESEEDPHS